MNTDEMSNLRRLNKKQIEYKYYLEKETHYRNKMLEFQRKRLSTGEEIKKMV